MKTNTLLRRTLLAQLAGGALAIALGSVAFAARDDDGSAPVIPSGEIVQKLIGKDIVLDPSGAGGTRNLTVQPVGVSLRLHFAFGSSRLLTQGQRQLDQLAAALNHQDLGSYAFELAGHTDSVGSHAANMRLSLARANAAKAYLVQTHGLAGERLKPIGFGFTRLANPADPTSGLNRRVEVRRLRLEGPAAAPAGSRATPGAGALVPTPKSF